MSSLDKQLKDAHDQLIRIHASLALYLSMDLRKDQRAKMAELQDRLEYRTKAYDLQLTLEKIDIYSQALKFLGGQIDEPGNSKEKYARRLKVGEFALYIGGLIKTLDSHRGVDFTEKEKAAIECLGRQRAAELLTEALSTLLQEEPHATMKDDRDDYSIDVE